MFSRTYFWPALLSGGLSSCIVYAQESSLPAVVVTATRTPQTVEATLASTSVISREDIERLQAVTLTDILRGTPGLSLASNGPRGSNTSVFLRGTESDHVTVLIDGIKVGSATLGTTPFQQIPAAQIERIEIVRGPRSALYGSEAIGGVIQIFTRRSRKPRIEASASMGSDNTYGLTAGTSGQQSALDYSVYANYYDTDGFNACNTGNGGTAACFTIEPDNDGHDNRSLSTRLGYRFSDMFRLDGQVLHTTGTTAFDSSFGNQLDFTNQVLGLTATLLPADGWESHLQLGQSIDESKTYGAGSSRDSVFNTKRLTLSWQNDVFIQENYQLTFGYDYLHDEIDSTSSFSVDSRDNHGLFLQYQGQAQDWNWLIGGRYDDNEQFGQESTFNISLGYQFTPVVRGFVSYGTAFKAPSFNELYFPGFGNPMLAPETASSYEIGLTGNYDSWQWSINGFRTEVDDLIATSFDAKTNNFSPANTNRATINGMEARIAADWQHWIADLHLTLLNAENVDNGNELPRRARYNGGLRLGYQRASWETGLQLFAESRRFDDTANLTRLAGYGRLDLYAAWHPVTNWTVRFRVDNVLDKAYEEAHFYETGGRLWMLTAHYQQ